MRAKPNTASVYHTAAGIARREETEDANMLVVLSSDWKFGAVVLCNSSMYRSRFLSAPRAERNDAELAHAAVRGSYSFQVSFPAPRYGLDGRRGYRRNDCTGATDLPEAVDGD